MAKFNPVKITPENSIVEVNPSYNVININPITGVVEVSYPGIIGPAGPSGSSQPFTPGSGSVYTTTSSLEITGSVSATEGFTGSLEGTASVANIALTASFFSGSISNAVFAISASYASSSTSASYALSSSRTINALTASSADQFNIRVALTASGLKYPTADNGALSFIQTDGAGNLSLQYVKTIYEEVKNRESVTIPKGTALYVDGNTGNRADVYIADAYNPNRRPATLIAATDITPSSNGLGIVLGLIEGVNVGSLPAGTDVYLSSSGQWTSIRPTGDNVLVQYLGTISRTGNNGAGYVLNPGPFNLPNLPPGNVWIGNSGSFPVATSTSSIQNVISSSYALTASFALNAGGATNTGSFVTTSSFNSYTQSINSFTASYNTGSFTGSFTGSLLGTSSWAQSSSQTISSSYALTASFALNAGGAINTSSFVTTSSFNSFTQSINSFTSSYNTGSFTGSFTGSVLGTSSWSVSSSRATTSSFALTSSLPLQGIITASANNTTITFTKGDGSTFNVTVSQSGSVATASYALFAETASLAPNYTLLNTFNNYTGSANTGSFTGSFTGSLLGTSSWSVSASQAISSSYALTASFALNAGTTVDTGSFVTTSSFNSYTQSINNFTSSYNTGSFTGSFTGSLLGTSSWSVSSSRAITSSFAISASFATTSSLPLRGVITASATNTTITFTRGDGTTFDVTVSQSGSVATASYALFAETASLSPNYTLLTDFNNYTGSARSGSFTGSFTGSLFGTSSWAVSASQAISSSFASTASFALNAGGAIDTGSFVTTSSFNSYTQSINNFTSSYNTGSFTGSFTGSLLGTSSWAISSSQAISSSFATTASFALNAGTNINTGSFVTTSSFNSFTQSINNFTSSYNTGSFTGSFTGSLLGTSSWSVSSSTAITSSFALTASFAPNYTLLTTFNNYTGSVNTGSFTGSFTGSVLGTSSYATNALSSSYALTASFALNAGVPIDTGSFVTTSSFNSYTQSINNFTSSYNTGSFTGSFSGSFSGSISNAISASYALTASYALNGGAGGGNTQIYIDQSPDNGSYGLLTGSIDGINNSFTVSQGVYITGTLVVAINGQVLTQGASQDWVETTPSTGVFTFNTAPPSGSVLTAWYNKTVVVGANFTSGTALPSGGNDGDIYLQYV